MTKRQKEMARQQKQQDKRARRLESKNRGPTGAPRSKDEDPDLEGIQAGPQPPPPWADNDRSGY